jgi:hypothetical protein
MKKLRSEGSVLYPFFVLKWFVLLLIVSDLQIWKKKSVQMDSKVSYLCLRFKGEVITSLSIYHPMNILFPMKPIVVLLQTYLLFPPFFRHVAFSPPDYFVVSMNEKRG